MGKGNRSFKKDVFAHPCGQPGSDPSDRPAPGPPPRREVPIPLQRDESDSIRKPRTRRYASSGFDDVSPDSSMLQDPGYDADVEVVRPYAIEEPDDDADQTSASASTRPATPRLLDSTECWQTELVNGLRGLACDSDSNEPLPLLKHKRGRKRKTDTSRELSQSFLKSSNSRGDVVDLTVDEPPSLPKRRRRKSTKATDEIKSADSPLRDESHLDSSPSCTIFPCSTHEQTPQNESTISTPAVDQMDLD